MEIFDSLIHPSDTATWFDKNDIKLSFKELQNQGRVFRDYSGCAVALPNMGFEEPAEYFSKCLKGGFYPVYFYDFFKGINQLDELHEIGYRAVKIHTRLSKVNIEASIQTLRNIFEHCEAIGLKVFFCTYFHGNILTYPTLSINNLIVKLFRGFEKLKVVLLHGGDVSLMNVAQVIRFNENFLLDVSYTMMKFQGSSVQGDIKYLMSTMDRRISVGSDWPDYNLSDFKIACEDYTRLLDKPSRDLIYSKNIVQFLEI